MISTLESTTTFVPAAHAAAAHAMADADGPTCRPPVAPHVRAGLDAFEQEQMFEEDVRAVLKMLRPNRRERLLGWNEYRTGGAHFRATISWDPQFAHYDPNPATVVPNLADVLEAILIGSAKSDVDLPTHQEFDVYRKVVRDLYRRLNEAQACYE